MSKKYSKELIRRVKDIKKNKNVKVYESWKEFEKEVFNAVEDKNLKRSSN